MPVLVDCYQVLSCNTKKELGEASCTQNFGDVILSETELQTVSEHTSLAVLLGMTLLFLLLAVVSLTSIRQEFAAALSGMRARREEKKARAQLAGDFVM